MFGSEMTEVKEDNSCPLGMYTMRAREGTHRRISSWCHKPRAIRCQEGIVGTAKRLEEEEPPAK